MVQPFGFWKPLLSQVHHLILLSHIISSGLQEINIKEVILHPKPRPAIDLCLLDSESESCLNQEVESQPNPSTSCLPGSDIASCLHNLHIHRASHCFDNMLNTTCKAHDLDNPLVQAISVGFQSEADVKSVTIYNPEVEFPLAPKIKVVATSRGGSVLITIAILFR